MLVTAVLDPAVASEFDAWHRETHLPRVLAIPGVVRGRRLLSPPSAPNYAAIYVFADDGALRTALASPQAQEARGDWQRWMDHIRDLTVTFYAEFQAQLPLFRGN